MATRRREHRTGLIIHSDRGVQFTSWAFSERIRDAGIAPSMGSVGSAFDNAMMESFWARMQVELFNRRKWKTRIELASGIHDYIELWHNTHRRHSALGILIPFEIEAAWTAVENGSLIEADHAKPAPQAPADGSPAPGLSDPDVEALHRDHQHLLLNNDQAA